ncbi:MAG: hypothetical protein M3143_04045 [Actinomycetota bacterium]|nr:hypothetical protein [Actinomycetota bacterium]
MQSALSEELRISPRLKNALVADLVIEDLGPRGDRWLTDPMRNPDEWTEHLGRQLGMTTTYGPGGIHDTLLVVVLQLDAVVRTWPPQHDLAACRQLAHEATKHLSPIELVATLLAGPLPWRRSKLEAGCRVDGLSAQLQPLLEKALATDLNRVLEKWVEWDIRKLRERRQSALDAQTADRVPTAAAAPTQRVRYQRPTGRDLTDLITPRYQPPGRT